MPEPSKKNVVGRVNEGWTVAKTASPVRAHDDWRGRRSPVIGFPVAEVAKKYLGTAGGKIADPELRQQITQHAMDDRSFGLTVRRTGEESKSTKAPSFRVLDVQIVWN